MTRIVGGERGSVSIVLVALLGVVVLLATGVADAAAALHAAERAQDAADAAALAAAQELAMPEGRTPDDVAAEYAQRNGGVLVACACDPAAFEVVVTVRAPVGRLWLFADDLAADASARAVVVIPAS
jgi:secretion/DNA translocation related TadE-like protein